MLDRMKLFLVAPLMLTLALASPSAKAPAQAPAEPTIPVEIGDDGLVVDRPALWQVGFMRGPTILLHFVGNGDGFPHFSVMADREAALPAEADPAEGRAAVEELFAAIVGEDEMIESGWTEINGIAVHSSLAIRGSVAGRIQRRRLMLVHAGVPYVLVWAHYADRYGEVADLIEQCVASLKLGHGPGRVAAMAPAR
jgi:hypothetical protein